MADQAPKSPNYRKPPVEHQFKKGQSGNPKGRPKKKPERVGIGTSGSVFDRVAKMALEEATRPLTVREGERVERLPAIQAVIRSMFRLAAQGDSKAQRLLLDVISRAESDRATATEEFSRFILQYQAKGKELLAKHEREGLQPPELFPHPDDIIFDLTTGEVTIDGPLTKEHAGAEKVAAEYVASGLWRYLEIERKLKKDPKNRKLRKELAAHKQYKMFVDKLGERYVRREGLRLSREAMNPRPTKRRTATAKSKDGGPPTRGSEP